MRPELQAQILQSLNIKRTKQGFTLVELLVVIVIIGILTAVALPSLLNQSAKAKQSEAKQYISAINRAQTYRRAYSNSFATTFDELAIGVLTGNGSDGTGTYNYTMNGNTDTVTTVATAKDSAIKSYSSAILRYTNAKGLPNMISKTCENVYPGITVADAVTIASNNLNCPVSTININ